MKNILNWINTHRIITGIIGLAIGIALNSLCPCLASTIVMAVFGLSLFGYILYGTFRSILNVWVVDNDKWLAVFYGVGFIAFITLLAVLIIKTQF